VETEKYRNKAVPGQHHARYVSRIKSEKSYSEYVINGIDKVDQGQKVNEPSNT
jgi:hypothetical protein